MEVSAENIFKSKFLRKIHNYIHDGRILNNVSAYIVSVEKHLPKFSPMYAYITICNLNSGLLHILFLHRSFAS